MATYADLEITLRPHQGEASYEVDLSYTQPGGEAEIQPLDQPADLTLDVKELRQHHLDNRDYGQTLTDRLLGIPGVQAAYRQVRSDADTQKVPLRVRLRIDTRAAELHGLRWETLREPGPHAGALSTSQRLYFSRFLRSGDFRPVRPRAKRGIKALVVIANPSDLDPDQLPPIDVPGELDRATTALDPIYTAVLARIAKPPQSPEHVQFVGRATLSQVKEQLRQGYDILYLVCHGVLEDDGEEGDPLLWLEDDRGRADVVSGTELATHLTELPEPPRLVVLASCQSAGSGDQRHNNDGGVLAALGPQLARAGVPSVLAMQGNITQTTLEQFMPTFFETLQKEGQIDLAVAVARGQVRRRRDWWMPVLFMRLKSGQLWLPEETVPRLDFEPETVPVRAGEFIMGSDPAEGIPETETPAVKIDLPEYWIGKYPVTVKEYAAFMRDVIEEKQDDVSSPPGWSGATPPDDSQETEPVAGVTWFEAKRYCEWLKEKTCKAYSLPSEAQWEKAARGDQGLKYPWGNEWVAEDQPPSPYRCHKMVGHVREWTRTLWGVTRPKPDEQYADAYSEEDEKRNDLNKGKYIYRVYRGGPSAPDEEGVRCSARGAFLPYHRGPRGNRHGFRVVWIPEARSEE